MALPGVALDAWGIADEFIDLSPTFQVLKDKEFNFLSLLDKQAIKGMTEDFQIQWGEGEMNAQTVIENGAIASGATVLNVDAGHGARVRVGSILMDTTASKLEQIQVTAISTDALTVTRSYGTVAAESHADDAVWNVIAEPIPEYADPSGDRSTTRSVDTNYVQLFEDIVLTSWVRQYILKSRLVPDEHAHQIAQRVMEMMQLIDRTLIHGEEVKATINGADYYTMGGLRPFVIATGGNITTTTEDLSNTALNDLNDLIYADAQQHSLPTCILTTSALARKFKTLDDAKIRLERKDTGRGYMADHYLFDHGNEAQIMADRNMHSGELILLNPENIVMREALPLSIGPVPTRKIANESRLLMGLSVEWRYALKLFAIHTNLS